MQSIRLNKDKFALIDDEDLKLVSKYNWQYNNGYAVTSYVKNKKRYYIKMHRLVMGVDKLVLLDHINRNSLDNRKKNLRKSNSWLNAFNKGIQKNNKTGYKGVVKLDGKYAAQLQLKYRCKRIGTFKRKQDAACAYNVVVSKLTKGHAFLNILPKNHTCDACKGNIKFKHIKIEETMSNESTKERIAKRRKLRDENVWKLHKKGWSMDDISFKLSLSKRDVFFAISNRQRSRGKRKSIKH